MAFFLMPNDVPFFGLQYFPTANSFRILTLIFLHIYCLDSSAFRGTAVISKHMQCLLLLLFYGLWALKRLPHL